MQAASEDERAVTATDVYRGRQALDLAAQTLKTAPIRSIPHIHVRLAIFANDETFDPSLRADGDRGLGQAAAQVGPMAEGSFFLPVVIFAEDVPQVIVLPAGQHV